jgi:hypothetical protein
VFRLISWSFILLEEGTPETAQLLNFEENAKMFIRHGQWWKMKQIHMRDISSITAPSQ